MKSASKIIFLSRRVAPSRATTWHGGRRVQLGAAYAIEAWDMRRLALLACSLIAADALAPVGSLSTGMHAKLRHARDAILEWAVRVDGVVAQPNCGTKNRWSCDATFWNGLLCSKPNSAILSFACQSVARSQTANGMLWRSPWEAANQSSTNPDLFSRDQGLGALAGFSRWHNSSVYDRWTHFIATNSRWVGPSMCPGHYYDCLLVPPFWCTFDKVARYAGLTPPPAEWMSPRLGSGVCSNDHAAVYISCRFNELGSGLHLASVDVYIRRLIGDWDRTMQLAAEALHQRQPLNAWFAWLAHGASDHLAEHALQYIAAGDRSSHQWSFVREDAEEAWKASMGWEWVLLIEHMLDAPVDGALTTSPTRALGGSTSSVGPESNIHRTRAEANEREQSEPTAHGASSTAPTAIAALTIDATSQSERRPFRHVWGRVIGSGHAKLGRLASWRAQLRRVREEVGVDAVRFHGVLDDDMGPVVSRVPGGTVGVEAGDVEYNFTAVAQLYDYIVLELGMAPYVELSFMPRALASAPVTTRLHYRAIITPPTSLAAWGQLIDAFGRFLVHRYGIERVSTWRFEVWNEPNLPLEGLQGFWTGSMQEYFGLYAATAAALKRVSPRLQVGGPASAATPSWVAELLAFCSRTGTALDFVSSHAYPAARTPNATAFGEALARSASLAAPRPFILSEFNSGLGDFCCHDTEIAAVFLARAANAVQRDAAQAMPEAISCERVHTHAHIEPNCIAAARLVPLTAARSTALPPLVRRDCPHSPALTSCGRARLLTDRRLDVLGCFRRDLRRELPRARALPKRLRSALERCHRRHRQAKLSDGAAAPHDAQ